MGADAAGPGAHPAVEPPDTGRRRWLQGAAVMASGLAATATATAGAGPGRPPRAMATARCWMC
jgi:hypothetical protein